MNKTEMRKAASKAASLPQLRKSFANTLPCPRLPPKPASEQRLTGRSVVRTRRSWQCQPPLPTAQGPAWSLRPGD